MVELAIYAFVAAFIFFRLYSSLGRASSVSFQSGCSGPGGADDGRVVCDPQGDSPDVSLDTVTDAEHSASVAPAIAQIHARNSEFTLRNFMSGSAAAFELIMKALSKGDTELLATLLTDDMYKSFEKEIEQRRSEKRFHEDVVVSILSQKIHAARVEGDTAYIKVKFLTEQINVIRDGDGNVTDGSTSNINVVEDFWTFERDVIAPGRKWYLSSTLE